jgi:regulation of enolase protein 1 (concanavalin A-like superfamily)
MHDMAPKVPTARPVHKRFCPFSRLLAVVVVSLLSALVGEERPKADTGLPGTWSAADVGSPAIRGAALEGACTAVTGCPLFTITGAGTGVAGVSDQFMYLSQRLTGDGAVTMRLLSLVGATTVEAGLMVRESLAGSSRHASLLASATGLSFRSRTTTGGATASLALSRGSWLRLERVGPIVTASVSNDGSQWTVAATQTMTLPSTVYVGIAVTSRSATAGAIATVSSMSVSSTTPTLPPGWASADIGSAPSAGTASYSNSSFIAASSAVGFANAADAFRFIYTRTRGDAKLTTRVAASEGRIGRQAGIVLRATLEPGALETALVADDAGIVLVKRTAAAQPSTKTRVSTSVAPVYLQLDRRGSTVTAAYSTDGVTWRTAATATMSFPSEIYAGLAVAAGPNGGVAAAAFDRLSLVSVAANAAPVVSLTAPATGQIFMQGKAVTMTATASDPDDLVARVDFLVNGVKVATDTAAPYTASWIAGTPGVYAVVASAADFDGAVTNSAPALITVIPAVIVGPDVPDSGSDSDNDTETGPWRLEFDVSADHLLIERYILDIYNKDTGSLVVTRDLGKPTCSLLGACAVDVDALINALPSGVYEVIVRAKGLTGITAGVPYILHK